MESKTVEMKQTEMTRDLLCIGVRRCDFTCKILRPLPETSVARINPEINIMLSGQVIEEKSIT